MNIEHFSQRMNRKLFWASVRGNAWKIALIVTAFLWAILYPLK